MYISISKNVINSITGMFFQFQESVEDIQKRSEMSLLKSEESFSSQLRLLEQTRDKLEAKSSRMKEELNSTRRQEAHLRALVADLGQEISFVTFLPIGWWGWYMKYKINVGTVCLSKAMKISQEW